MEVVGICLVNGQHSDNQFDEFKAED